ncbi:MAG: dienelactone hydrolase family protein [Rhodospirillaceae bacterium]|jgi:carboxymethylenebutenolidase
MGKNLTLTASDGHSLDAYQADPAGNAKGRLVVIQEIFGVNSHIQGVCDRFAEAGYVALAPAMFDRLEKNFEVGYEPDDVAKGRDLKDKASYDDAMKDVQAAIDALKGDGKVGVVGYCWGGSVTWLSACRISDAAAAVCYYGGNIHDFNNENPQCPTLLHFGEIDQSIPLDKVDDIQKAHPDVPSHIYPNAAHGFNCEQRGSYDEASAKLALGRTLEFFEKHLG